MKSSLTREVFDKQRSDDTATDVTAQRSYFALLMVLQAITAAIIDSWP
jgi:hypothetical protein